MSYQESDIYKEFLILCTLFSGYVFGTSSNMFHSFTDKKNNLSAGSW